MNKKKQVLHTNGMQVPAFYFTMRDIVNEVLQVDYKCLVDSYVAS